MASDKKTEDLPLAGMRVGIFTEFNYEDLELLYPLHRFREDGATTFTIGPEAGKVYTGKHGYPNKCDKKIDDVSSKDLDALIVPGGYAPDYWRRNAKYTGLTAAVFAEGKPVASICHGPHLLISAGVLKGKKATCFHSIKDDIVNAGATYVDSPVVVDGNLITSRIPDDLGVFCKAVSEQLKALKAKNESSK